MHALRILFITFILSLQFQHVDGQLEAGFKLGASTYQFANPDLKAIVLQNENVDEYKLSVEDVNFGYHLGLYGRLKVWKIILQPEVILNSNSVNYRIEDFANPSNAQFLSEQYTNLDLPVLLGVKFSWFSIQAGVSGHLPIASVSELKNIEGYKVAPASFTYSYLGGIGIDFWKFRFDARFELSTTYFGDHIEYKGVKYQFEDQKNRIIVGLGYKF